MYEDSLVTIFCSWDESGDISRNKNSFVQAHDIKEQDALALSVPLMISSQLGILNISSVITLCGNCLDYLAKPHSTILAIPPVLRSVRIELHRKGKTIVETFWPDIINGDDSSKEYEDAILRFYNNYILYVHENVTGKLDATLKQSLLASVYFFLDKALPKIINRPTFALDNFSRDVQMTMLSFCETIYPHWGDSLYTSRFTELLGKAQKQYQHIRAKLL